MSLSPGVAIQASHREPGVVAAGKTGSLSSTCPVNSHNEWDPLEEVIVGRLDGATIPSNHPAVTCNIPGTAALAHAAVAGMRFPKIMTEPARRELEGFVTLLESLGITVRRPDAVNWKRRFGTPEWRARGFVNACPRDSMLIVGDEIIETPMAWPSRYFETYSFRTLLKGYFRAGARWTSAPKPELADPLFDRSYRIPKEGEPIRSILTEWEPVFDAADFMRCGRDLFVTKSNVTNRMGIEWLRRHLSDRGYQVHEIESLCRTPMHIDTTFVPLAPGKVLVNPEYVDIDRLPPILKGWDILVAPEPDPIENPFLRVISMCGKWLSMNVLSIDGKRV